MSVQESASNFVPQNKPQTTNMDSLDGETHKAHSMSCSFSPDYRLHTPGRYHYSPPYKYYLYISTLQTYTAKYLFNSVSQLPYHCLIDCCVDSGLFTLIVIAALISYILIVHNLTMCLSLNIEYT